MYKTILQVPMAVGLRRQAEKEALKQGFSSLQEFMRLVARKLAERRVGIRIEEEETVQLSPRAIRRYDKMDEEIASGKVKLQSFSSVDAMMKSLNK